VSTEPRWSAYCARGRKAYAALALMLEGREVTAITETAAIEGGGIILINDAAIEEALTLPAGYEFELRSPMAESEALRNWRIGAMCGHRQPFMVPIIGG
jgi:hypothetical protein